MQLSKVCVRSSFKRLARVALCLLLCVTMLGTTGVFGAMQAFAEQVHKYQLVPDSDETQTYGHVNWRYNETTGKWEEGHFKIVTKENYHWGHGGAGDTKLYFNWHTATSDTDSNRLEESVTESGDVYVIYNKNTAHYKTNRTAEGIDTSITDYIESHADGIGGAIYNNTDNSEKNVIADFLGNYVESEIAVGGGAIYNNRATIGNITGDFIDNYAEATSYGVATAERFLTMTVQQ